MTRLLLGLLALAAAGCGIDLPGKPDPAQREKKPDEIRDFATLYEKNCSGCHGAEGRLGSAPPLNDPLLLAILSEEQIRKVLQEGRPGTPMPLFAHANGGILTAEQIDILAQGLNKEWRGTQSKGTTIPPYLASGTGDPAAGAKVFARACASCHGAAGQGGQAGAINDPAFLGLLTDQAIRRLIITGRPDLGMPSFSDSRGRDKDFKPLTDREVTDLTAHVAGWRRTSGDKR
ncbi:MAG: c-type cytochrome [Gemmataceae bacterium]